MCLGVPGRVLEIHERSALVDFFGVRRQVGLQIVDEDVAVGDHVLVHVGFAIRRIAPEDVERTLAFFRELAGDELGPAPRELGS